MIKLFFCAAGLFALLPMSAFALCSAEGATVVYVNGIETTQQEAEDDTGALDKLFLQNGGASDVRILNGYNPTHLNGIGDEIESISQAFGSSISDYDLDTILDQIAPEITTRKLLLVGHSQGSFYTNEMYEYLVAHGVPQSSIAVYDLATPAYRVAGGGEYLTSANDKLINQVRVWDAEAGAPQPLPANILLPLQSGDDTDPYGGHYFQTDYLAGAGAKIVHNIENVLAGLSADGSSETKGCFDPPSQGLSYETQKVVFALTDPAAAGVDSAANKTASVIESAYSSANDAFRSALADAIFTVIPKPNADNAASAFAMEKALYGSSLSEADYEALLGDDDVPEVQPSQQTAVQAKASVNSNTATKPVQVAAEPKEIQTEEIQPVSLPAAPAPFPSLVSISPGFGGGSVPVASSASISPPSNSVSNTSSSSQTEIPPDTASTTQPTQPVSTSTDTIADDTAPNASSTASTSTAQTEATSTPQSAAQVSCDQDTFAANGYFFDSSYQQIEYVGGLLRVHLKLLTPYNDGRPFRAKVYEMGSDCLVPQIDGFSPQDHPSTTITANVQYYSFRMATPTHWILWDDENDLQLHCTICEGDISSTTPFVSFYGIVDDFTSNPSRVRSTPERPSE